MCKGARNCHVFVSHEIQQLWITSCVSINMCCPIDTHIFVHESFFVLCECCALTLKCRRGDRATWSEWPQPKWWMRQQPFSMQWGIRQNWTQRITLKLYSEQIHDQWWWGADPSFMLGIHELLYSTCTISCLGLSGMDIHIYIHKNAKQQHTTNICLA